MVFRVAELETVFTADIQDYVKKTDKVDKTSKSLEKSDPTVKVKAEEKSALAGLDRVISEAKKITDKDVVAKVDADIVKAQANTAKIKTDLTVLGSLKTDPTVTADITKAQKALDTTEARLKALQGARAEMVVVADTTKAERSIDGVAAKAGEAGAKGGKDAGEGLSAGIIGALVALPIAGTVVGIGVAIGKSLTDGLQVELRSDRLMAQTDLDPKQAAVIGRAAGEAYANNFGPSIAENMDAARVAIQGGLLDVDGTEQDSQAVIESLAGVADILGEEIPAVSRATAQLLRTGLAKDAAGAFDLLVRGTKAGLNVSEDLLDTVDEYSTQFRKLGLDGPQAFGLLRQAVKGGARDTDVAADSLKEFSIRAVDGSVTTVASFKAIGLNAKDMQGIFVKGGPPAAAALGLTLQKLRDMEPGAARTAAAVGLFGTMAEDMGNALYTMDLSTAVAQLGNVDGAAKTALATLGDNAAGQIESAKRNIQVASDGIKGALASAFAPQIKGFSTFVTENRGAVMQFLLDMANGSIDAGRALLNAAASGTEGFGSMIGTIVPGLLSIIGTALKVGQAVAFALDPTGVKGLRGEADRAVDSFRQWAPTAAAGAKAIESGSKTAADKIREDLIKNGLDPAQKKLNDLGNKQVLAAGLHDASVKLAKSIDGIGYAADGSRLKLATHAGAVNLNTAAGKRLDAQIRGAVGALDKEAVAGAKAGDSQKTLTTRYEAGRQQLIKQLVAMGFTAAQAQKLTDKYNAIPGKKVTNAILNKDAAAAKATALQKQIDSIKQNKVLGLAANSKAAKDKIAALQKQINVLKGKSIDVNVLFNKRPTGAYGTLGYGVVAPDGADGGPVTGGIPHRDSVLRTLMPKEYIIREDGSNLADAAAYYGVAAPGMAKGGPIEIGMPSGSALTRASAGASDVVLNKLDVTKLFGGSGGAGGAAKWSSTVLAVLAMMGQSPANLGAVLRLINKESGGNARAINLTDSNAMAGTPSMGLIQTILPTFLANAGPFAILGPYNPFANIYAGLHHAISAWGSIAAVDPLVHVGGYDTGGVMPPGAMGQNRGPKPERVLSGHQTESFDRLVAMLPGLVGSRGTAAPPQVHVYVDGQEFRGMVRVEVDGHTQQLVDALVYS